MHTIAVFCIGFDFFSEIFFALRTARTPLVTLNVLLFTQRDCTGVKFDSRRFSAALLWCFLLSILLNLTFSATFCLARCFLSSMQSPGILGILYTNLPSLWTRPSSSFGFSSWLLMMSNNFCYSSGGCSKSIPRFSASSCALYYAHLRWIVMEDCFPRLRALIPVWLTRHGVFLNSVFPLPPKTPSGITMVTLFFFALLLLPGFNSSDSRDRFKIGMVIVEARVNDKAYQVFWEY